MAPTPAPFRLAIPDADLADLKDRLARTRFPDQTPGAPWAYGTDVAYMKDLVEYWRTRFDWRAQEAALNAFPQFTVELHDIPVHFLHVPGQGPAPMPLLLSHGWPGSVFEFLDIIPRLTDPARFGGDAKDAFTVVAPSLPGYGLSFRPGQKRFGVPEMADCFADLMTDVLGYSRFAAQGGDWGSGITSRLGYAHAGKMIGIHLNMMMAAGRDPAAFVDPNEEERAHLENMKLWFQEETGYQAIQGTKPQTLAFGLTDSPAGLAAWIVEKFRSWTDCGDAIENAVPRDKMLADISLYWFTGAIGSSFWPYYARLHGVAVLPPGDKITVPTGYAQFPREMLRPPRSAAEKVFTDLRRWSVMPKGGHFAALEQPELLAHEIREFFRELR
ncbi:MAG: epoxide hydrolase [Proteobacteria bacterium]|nr:epoxide hydrolase [Pseudomonadota bacterium]